MSDGDTRAVVLEELGNIAPEADLSGLDPKVDFRGELEINSMDFLNFIIAMHKRLGINIPERDYGKLVTLDGAIHYLAAKLATLKQK